MTRTKTEIGRSSKRKGNAYQLKIAKLFTAWWGYPVYSTPASGGTHWEGDLICQEQDLPFSVECKKQESWSFDGLFRELSPLWGFWSQCKRDAQESGKAGLLVFSKNRRPDYFMIKNGALMRLEEWCGFFGGSPILEVHKSTGSINIGLLSEFLDWLDPEGVKACFKEKKNGN